MENGIEIVKIVLSNNTNSSLPVIVPCKH